MAVIKGALPQILAEQIEMDSDFTPRTMTAALLAEGRFEEAEAAARKAVSDLEEKNVTFGNNLAVVQSKNLIGKGGSAALNEQNATARMNSQLSLLAEALIAHGISLARLKKFDAAQASLERAIAVAQAGNAPVKASLAALTMIEEVEGLSRETLLRAYELASSKRPTNAERGTTVESNSRSEKTNGNSVGRNGFDPGAGNTPCRTS